MKTVLPDSIHSIKRAKQFLTDLYKNGESYHPEDDANDIIWNTCEPPSIAEKNQLNLLMDDIYNVVSLRGSKFDPCAFLLSLSRINVKRGKFTYDGEHVYTGYTNGATWNGFQCPYFSKSVALQICRDINNSTPDEGKAYFDAAKNCFFVDDDGFCENEVFFNGRSLLLFAVGSWAWTWQDATKE